MEKRLDNNWLIEADDYSWKLVHRYTKKVDEKLKDKSTGKFIKTGKKVDKEFEENWWYPKLSMCVAKYQEEVLKPLASLEEVSNKLSNIESMLGELEKSKFNTFKRC